LKEPPKPIEQAPFFLPTLPGVETRFALTEQDTQKQKKPTKRLDKASSNAGSVFHTLLSEADPEGDCKSYLNLSGKVRYSFVFSDEGFFSHAKMLQPAALDLELRSLNSIQILKTFMRALRRRLATHRDFEGVEAMMNVFLHIHADVLIANEELSEGLEELEEVQKRRRVGES
jgi:U3 small nucleolar RNA-associated protein 21